jgi:ElaB/YqjD/DUF883 family membrane-anchored ribosome-binding protein
MKTPDKNIIKKAQAEIRKMKNKYVAAEKDVMEHAKKNPELALLVAAGIGAAVGAITVAILKNKKPGS